MKKTTLILIMTLFIITACGQSVSQTFNKIIWAKEGIKFGDNTIQTTAGAGSVSTIVWTAITEKPTFATVATTGSYSSLLNIPTLFPPAAHNHDGLYKSINYVPDYSEITNKPSEIELIEAISSAQYLIIPKLTTIQITTLIPQPGIFVYDVTLNVLKYHNGTEWKVLITNQ